ncbi:DUF3613 domain-containing protein [Stenotrophomonas sp. GD04145]|uniref:DUF3613 domain-containing protein n=1 Tax=Stenotrophomonas sp. GD04145 TaxID=2975436 RepID=UPI002448DB69|nr:DUF3613 domain-containing protein [Stenotrophomonas sp. GD04145]MDH0170208.1 DUF3613 domain-containing protein [Stenotrophomonas sp. GD04145]
MTAMTLIRRLLPAVTCCLLATGAHAQSPQAPLTGQMLGGSPAAGPAVAPQQVEALATVDLAAPAPPPAMPTAPPAPVAAAPAAPRRNEVGDATRQLFQLQASGQQAGARLPILGDQATASYARYLKSFEQDIPAFFDTDVGSSKSTSNSGR